MHQVSIDILKMKKLNKKGPSDFQRKLQKLDDVQIKLFGECLFMLSETCVKLSALNSEIQA
jgi:hypothetical protein